MSNSSREAMLAAVKINGDALMTCTNVKLRNDKEIVMEAVKTGQDALLWASDNMRKDVDVLFEAVTYNGRALRYAIGLRDHKKIVLQACKQDGNALQFASNELRSNIENCKAAVIQTPFAIQYCSARIFHLSSPDAASKAATVSAM